jgi:hypothetical protein
MPTPPRRWSTRLEEFRAGADTAAQYAAADLSDATVRITRARLLIRSSPDLADKLLAEALASVANASAGQERIRRLMLEASIGRA